MNYKIEQDGRILGWREYPADGGEVSWLDIAPEIQQELLQAIRDESEERYLKVRREIHERVILDTVNRRKMQTPTSNVSRVETIPLMPKNAKKFKYESEL